MSFSQVVSDSYHLQQTSKDVFSPLNISDPREGHEKAAFGGLLLSQALAAAELTVSDDLLPNNLQATFLLNVDTSLPVEYHIKRVKDGASFCNRFVDVVQNGKSAVSLHISFHKKERDYFSHQVTAPQVPPPESLPSLREELPKIKEQVQNGSLKLSEGMLERLERFDTKVYISDKDFFEVRPTDMGSYYGYQSSGQPHQMFWMRSRGHLPENGKIHRRLMTHNTDWCLGIAGVSPHNSNGFQMSMAVTLNYSMWFHRPGSFRADQWHLFDVYSQFGGGGRLFSTCNIFSRCGDLLGTCTQEMLIRSRSSTTSNL